MKGKLYITNRNQPERDERSVYSENQQIFEEPSPALLERERSFVSMLFELNPQIGDGGGDGMLCLTLSRNPVEVYLLKQEFPSIEHEGAHDAFFRRDSMNDKCFKPR